ncbi:MAG: BREX-1 system adenine-specific DNA-methyltransferase PglX [Dethiobacteria bacterium]
MIDTRSCSSDFSKIPGSPIAYWFTTKALSLYKNKKIIDISNPCKGIDTGDNNRFLRIWHEVSINKQHIPGYAKVAQSKAKRKWFPYNKGGPYHKWYGNNEYVLNYENEGEALRQFKGSNLRNSQYYFRSGITWTTVTSGKLSLRYFAQGYLFDNGGCCLYADNNLLYIMALLNSSVTTSLLNVSPTLNYQPGDIGRVPVLIDENSVTRVEKLVKTNIALSKTDWDSFETSWDFKCHPFLTYKDNATTIEEAFGKWSSFAESQFNQLKQNEKELNRIFIDIYGLQDELTPEVKDEDITINKADRERDIKSFISYAVGCMFGRYSLDKEGLIYAGGDFGEKYRVNNGNWEINVGDEWLPSSVRLAANNIIPIVDGDYFEDGVLERFVEFVKVSFGKETLEENLDYIAASLGVRAGETPRQAIRRYFLRNFYKDHVRTYKKRPIYWLFDSGRRDGFKALVYLHRYDPYTVARVRTDYLHKLQRKYEAETKHLDILIGSEISGRERAATRRRKENIRGKLQECLRYDQVIAHVANQRIELDLDDGVKVNYAKFQGVKIPRSGGKPLKADLLAKI